MIAKVSRYSHNRAVTKATDRAVPPGLPQTADRALQILLAFDRNHPEWGVTEVAREFGLHNSIAQRLLAVLAHRGFLVRDEITRRYRIGPAALHLGRLWERVGALDLMVAPILRDLAEQTGHSALLSVPDGAHTRCVLAAQGSDGRLRGYSLVGELYPAHAGATSKAYFAHLPPPELAQLFHDRPMARFTENTVTDMAELKRQFAEVRERGWAYTVGEYDSGVATLAVPVFLRGEPYGSLSVGWSATKFRHDPQQWVDLLRNGADTVELRLSYPASRD